MKGRNWNKLKRLNATLLSCIIYNICRANNAPRKMKGGGLTYAACLAALATLLTCALSLRAGPEFDPKILQVTAGELNHPNHHLLGTAAELRFKSFIQEYGKEYSTRAEYLHRLGVFAENLIRAAEHQALDPTAKHGVTQFFDLSAEEFQGMYMGVRGGADEPSENLAAAAAEVEAGDLPESFDWREKGAVTDVKMQVMVFPNLSYSI